MSCAAAVFATLSVIGNAMASTPGHVIRWRHPATLPTVAETARRGAAHADRHAEDAATKVPVLGLGTWRMGERKSGQGGRAARPCKLGLELGIRLIDTAEMYGEGGAEEMRRRRPWARLRDEIYLVSKVYPHNASRKGTIAACERSLEAA